MKEVLFSVRPEISQAAILPETTFEERYQIQTLRPILKMHNERLVAIFKHYIEKRKQDWTKLTLQKKQTFIAHSLKTDQRLKSLYLGLVIGWITDEEYQQYITLEKAFHQRLTTLLIQRLQDQLVD